MDMCDSKGGRLWPWNANPNESSQWDPISVLQIFFHLQISGFKTITKGSRENPTLPLEAISDLPLHTLTQYTAFMYSFSYLEPVCCSMSSSNCCFLTCIYALNCGAGKDSWESLGMQGDQTSQSSQKSTLNIHLKECCWSSNTLATSCKELTHWKRPWCWERLRARGEGDDRGWNG